MEIKQIPLKNIVPNPQQPRVTFEAGALQELADSIRAHGLEQPIKVTPNGGPNSYILVDGERRWQAARLAGLKSIAAIVVDKMSERDMAEAALVANLHRVDLNAIEEARAYQTLIDLGLKVLDVSARTGKAVSQIYNRLQWLKLEAPIQQLVLSGRLQGDTRIAAALLKLPAGKQRLDLITKLAAAQATTRAILIACDKLAQQIADQAPDAKRQMRQRATTAREPAEPETWSLDQVREAARGMCQACEIRHEVLKGQVAEPGWTLIAHAADTVCAACNVREVRGACEACPGVELLRGIVAMGQIKAGLKHGR